MSVIGHRLLIIAVGSRASVADCQCQLSGIGCRLLVLVAEHQLLIVECRLSSINCPKSVSVVGYRLLIVGDGC